MAPTAPSLPPDFVDLLAAFAAASVRYLVIGGYAVDAANLEKARRRKAGKP